MGLSETILAAMIGAIATVSAALFQLFTAFKAKGRVDARPKRGLTTRSLVAVLALMTASAAGGFLYSEFLKQRSGEDIRAMRDELQELRRSILAERVAAAAPAPAPQPTMTPASLPTSLEDQSSTVESSVYVPACRAQAVGAACQESEAQRVALCGTVPSYARAQKIELFAQPDAAQHSWEDHRVAFEQDLGGARFTGKSFEYAQSADTKAVCVNFLQWSSEHPQIARMVITYGAHEMDTISAPAPTTDDGTHSPAAVAATNVLKIDSASAPAGAIDPAKPAL
ncbi:MAG TPA: hypothetical protein VFS24_05375 [Steroidobacteraceae bacterium]|nr:hypothetical protein [Steroidobacteraceae bacterium]